MHACLFVVRPVLSSLIACEPPTGIPVYAVLATTCASSLGIGHTLTYECLASHPYLESGDLTLTCLSDGTWEGDLPTCTDGKCVVISLSILVTCECYYSITPL